MKIKQAEFQHPEPLDKEFDNLYRELKKPVVAEVDGREKEFPEGLFYYNGKLYYKKGDKIWEIQTREVKL
jgi:hypothetical protein